MKLISVFLISNYTTGSIVNKFFGLIQKETKSDFNHGGLIISTNNELWVIEARDRIRAFRYEDWLKRAKRKIVKIIPVEHLEQYEDRVLEILGKPYQFSVYIEWYTRKWFNIKLPFSRKGFYCFEVIKYVLQEKFKNFKDDDIISANDVIEAIK